MSFSDWAQPPIMFVRLLLLSLLIILMFVVREEKKITIETSTQFVSRGLATATVLNIDAMLGCTIEGIGSIAAISLLQNYGHHCRTSAINHFKNTRNEVGRSYNTYRKHGAGEEDKESESGEVKIDSESNINLNSFNVFGSVNNQSYVPDSQSSSGVTSDSDFQQYSYINQKQLRLVPVDAIDSCCLKHSQCYNSLSLLTSTASTTGT